MSRGATEVVCVTFLVAVIQILNQLTFVTGLGSNPSERDSDCSRYPFIIHGDE